MNVGELAKILGADIAAGEGGLGREVSRAHAGDIVSRALTRCGNGAAWITARSNMNVVAAAVLKEMSCVVLCDGEAADDAVRARADMENMPIITCRLPAFEICACLAAAGLGAEKPIQKPK